MGGAGTGTGDVTIHSSNYLWVPSVNSKSFTIGSDFILFSEEKMNSDLNMKLLLFTERTHYLLSISLSFWFGLFIFLIKLFLNVFMCEILLYIYKYLILDKFYYTVCRSIIKTKNKSVRTFE